jgi:hypothetical protein
LIYIFRLILLIIQIYIYSIKTLFLVVPSGSSLNIRLEFPLASYQILLTSVQGNAAKQKFLVLPEPNLVASVTILHQSSITAIDIIVECQGLSRLLLIFVLEI